MDANRETCGGFAHDLPTGALKSCQICSSSDLAPVLDLGQHHSAPAKVATSAQLRDAEKSYPLRFLRCRECGLTQIDYVVPPEVVFHPEYPYRSGITSTLVKHLQSTAGAIVDNYKFPVGELAVDIGSNDGTLLERLQGALDARAGGRRRQISRRSQMSTASRQFRLSSAKVLRGIS